MDIEERRAIESDHLWLWNLYTDLMKPVIVAQWGWEESFQKEMFELHLPPKDFIVVTTRGIPVAAYLVSSKSDFLWLSMLLVCREYQRLGIGSRIIQQLIEQASRRSLGIKLNVINSNTAVEFYEKLGFEKDQYKEHNTSMVITHSRISARVQET